MWADSYKEAERYILELPKFTTKNDLEDTRLFLKVLLRRDVYLPPLGRNEGKVPDR